MNLFLIIWIYLFKMFFKNKIVTIIQILFFCNSESFATHFALQFLQIIEFKSKLIIIYTIINYNYQT
jgi:hypothetical protein